MINIPVEIKNLYASDSVRKNFRVRFPNGEHEDITNENVITESVSYKESICSQDHLKFGLCESSGISFDVAEVGNIKGSTIICQLEIDCSSLSTAFINQYCQRPADLDYPVYVIPYGKFLVTSCERDSSNMQLRTVQAYDSTWDDLKFSGSFEVLNWYTYRTAETINLTDVDFLNLLVPETCEQYMNMESTSFLPSGSTHGYKLKKRVRRADGSVFDAQISFTAYAVSDGSSAKRILGIYVPDVSSAYASAIPELKNCGFEGKDIAEMLSWKEYIYLMDGYRKNTYSGYNLTSYQIGKAINENLSNIEPGYHSYLYMNNAYDASSVSEFYFSNTYGSEVSSIQVFRPNSIEIKNAATGQVVYSETFVMPTMSFKKGYRNIGTSGINFLNLTSQKYTHTVLNTVVSTGTTTEVSRTDYKFNYDLSSINPKDLLEAIVEKAGKFGYIDRTTHLFGYVSIKPTEGLKPSNSLTPSQNLAPSDGLKSIRFVRKSLYSSLWYDDELTKKYSAVVCNYKNLQDEDEMAIYTIVNTSSTDSDGNLIYDPAQFQIYDVSDNYIISNGKYSRETIMPILQTIGENIRDVQYYPSRLDCKGMPWIESGDYISTQIENSDTVELLVLARTLNGIQSLEDSIESKG